MTVITSTAGSGPHATLGPGPCVRVLWSGKGLDYLFEAYRRLVEQQVDASLLLVGDGVDEDRYRAHAQDLPGIAFAGFVQQCDLPDFYALGDVLILPTLGDPHGLVIDEALAAGLPVICSESAGDIRSRLPDGRAGYIVPTGDPSALAHRMTMLATDSELRSRMAAETSRLSGKNGHAVWAEEFERFVFSVLERPARSTITACVGRAAGRTAGTLLDSHRSRHQSLQRLG